MVLPGAAAFGPETDGIQGGGDMVPRRGCRSQAELAYEFARPRRAASAPHEADDILDVAHGLGRQRLGALRPVGEHGVYIGRVLDEALHLAADRAEPVDREVDQ